MELDREYVYFKGKKLRYGYTTGSSATAATKAALMYLLDDSKHDIPEVTIKLPSGDSLTINVNSLEKKENSVLASVIKDGGDDPDVTHGLEIYSKVSLRNDSKINIYTYGIKIREHPIFSYKGLQRNILAGNRNSCKLQYRSFIPRL